MSAPSDDLSRWSSLDLQMALRFGFTPGAEAVATTAPPAVVDYGPDDLLAQVFVAEQLKLPYLPAELRAECREYDEWKFSSREEPGQLYELGFLARAFQQPVDDENPAPDYVELGYSGHGASSWAFSYALVEEGLGMFFQVPWTGPETDDDEGRQRIRILSAWSETLAAAYHEARRLGLLPANSRLVVVNCCFGDQYWGWIGPQGLERHFTRNPQNDAWLALQALMA